MHAAFNPLFVQSCSTISGTVTISDCLGLNTFNSTADVTLAQNGMVGLTISDFNATHSAINNVSVKVRHSGATGITGFLQLHFVDETTGVGYCTSSVVANTTSYTIHTVTACTPTGGWTDAKLDNLQIRIKNLDGGGTSEDAYVSWVSTTVNYTP